MKPAKTAIASLICAIALGSTVTAGEPADADGVDVGSKLAPRVRQLLIEEMNAVMEASESILAALVTRQDSVVAEKAQAIHDSFILKQEMTAQDRAALLDAVPSGFVRQDRAFHELSARLAQAARAGDAVRQRELFADMLDACVSCHSKYAVGRFP